MKKANVGKMDGLHDLLATYFTDQLESGEELSSGTLAAVNAFLKNNNITVDLVESSPMQNLQFKLSEMVAQHEKEAICQ